MKKKLTKEEFSVLSKGLKKKILIEYGELYLLMYVNKKEIKLFILFEFYVLMQKKFKEPESEKIEVISKNMFDTLLSNYLPRKPGS